MAFHPCDALPLPRVCGVPALYLDFDGVLHHENVCLDPKGGVFFGTVALSHGAANGHTHRLFEHASLLGELLETYPTVRLVLSTRWVLWRGFERARARLPTSLAQRCIGSTFHKRMDRREFLQLSRGMQIWSDVTRRQPSAWLAIDDDHADWPAWCENKLVRTDENLGISEPAVRAKLKAKLASTFGPGEA